MTKKEEFYLLLKMYNNGEYETNVFCNEVLRILFYESNGISEFTGKERESVEELANVVERYSPYKSDHEKFPNIYYTEKNVKVAVEKFYEQLK